MSRPPSEGAIYLSNISLEVRQQFGRPVHHIILQTNAGRFKKEIPGEFPPGYKHNEVFDPPLKLSAQDQLSVSMQYRWHKIGRTLQITVNQSEIMNQARVDEHDKETYVTFHKNIVVTINFARDGALPSTIGERSRDVPLPPTAGESSNDVPSPPTAAEGSNDISSPAITGESSDNISLPATTSESSHFTDLSPITNEILRVCPRFRVLIVGNSGVGKSTLIHNVFGVRDVDVSEASRGRADIDLEFVATENKLFVVHDSLGLEAAEGNNLEKVKDFIDGRRKQKDVKDRLHAVWVCLAVPYAKGRLLEAGMEYFLRNRKEILGDIPVVIVLTKLDLLDNYLMMTLRSEGVQFKSIEEAGPKLAPRRATFLEEYCTRPLLRAAESSVPHVAVSTISAYKLQSTISELVKITTSEIERYIKADPSYAAATEPQTIELNAPLYVAEMAQRASIEAKVDLAISIGKKRYWSNLGKCVKFSAEEVEEYLLVLHQDIIQAWNFHDPEKALQSDGLKEALLDTSDLGVDRIPNAMDVLRSMPLAPAMTSLLNDLTTVVVTLPLTATVALATLCSRIHKAAKTIAKRFMAYIVDLIYVMKILFVLAPQGSITSLDVGLAFEVYKRSTYRHRVHLELKGFGAGAAILPGGLEKVVDKIETLVRRYNLSDEEVSHLRSQIKAAPGRS